MKSMKTIVRIAAAFMLVAMFAGAVGCISSYNTNPVIARVGSVDLDLNRFLSLYNNTDTSSNPYYQYLQYGLMTREQYAEQIIEELVSYGVQLDQLKVQNITLDEAEEAELEQNIDKQILDYAVETYGSKVDSSITDADAKAQAALDLLKEELKKNNKTFESYRNDVAESLRTNARLDKLREITIGEINVTADDIKAYYEANAKAGTVSSFKSAFESFISNTSKSIPLAIPHPEKAVEDDPATEDTNEAKEADPYGEIFSVQHVLIKFATAPDDEGKENLEDYAASEESFVEKANAFEAEIPTLTTEQFIEKCHDKDVCEDPGMQDPVYMYFGYIMQQDVISSYYDGFGYAAMKLKFGDEWEPKASDSESESKPATYKVEYFDLTDGGKVAKVFTTAGAHYIIVNPNDCFGMYDENGYFMLPLYDGDNLVTDSEGIVTANGHMTQETFDLVNNIFAVITEKAETTEDESEKDEEEAEPVTLKSVYDYIFSTKKDSMESEKYSAIFKEWKDNTNISVNRSLLKPFMQNG